MKLSKGIIELPNQKHVGCSNSSTSATTSGAVGSKRRFKPRPGHVCRGMLYLRKDEDDLGQVSPSIVSIFLLCKKLYVFRSQTVKLLLNRGAPQLKDVNGNTPLHMACIRDGATNILQDISCNFAAMSTLKTA